MKIVYYPDPILFKQAVPFDKVTAEIHKLAQDMIKTMHDGNGVGLAGPQVGLSKQIIVINSTVEPGKDEVFLNPAILKRKGRVLGEEGCLSLPKIYGNVYRAQWIQFSAMLLTGEKVVLEAQDFRARVLQHEIDHLKGVLFINKIQPAEEVIVKRQVRELADKTVACASR